MRTTPGCDAVDSDPERGQVERGRADAAPPLPPFDVLYGAMFCSTQNELVEAVTTIAPPLPARAMARPPSWMHRKTPVRLTSRTRCQRVVLDLEDRLDVGDAGVGDHDVEPPERRGEASTAARTSARLDTSPADRLDAVRRTRVRRGRRGHVAVEVEHVTPAPSARNRSAIDAADPLGRAGDDHCLSVEALIGCPAPARRRRGSPRR